MSDPYQENMVYLLHGDGANLGTIFTDKSKYARSVAGGDANVYTSTAQFKWGTASIFDNGNGYLTVAAAPELQISAGADFTYEMWKYDTITVGANTELVSFGVSNISPFFLALNSGKKLVAQFRDASHASIGSQTGPTTVSLNTWHHIAAVLFGGVFSLYLDGNTEFSFTPSGTPGPITDGAIYVVGSGNFGSMVNAYQDDIRFTNGIARYTAPFTPPTGPFEDYVAIPTGGTVYGKLAPAPVYPPVFMGASLGAAQPRIWQERENLNVKVPK